MPMITPMAFVCDQNKNYTTNEWRILPGSYSPEDNQELDEIEALFKHLVFALKYEGINLLLFKFLCRHYNTQQLTRLVSLEPTGQYSRRIWFLIEWLTGNKLKGKKDLTRKSYVALIDVNQQFAVEGEKSPRHLVINNLPGTPEFCPLIKKSEKIKSYLNLNLVAQADNYLKGTSKSILQRASAFLLLKDSRASFSIEGESPKSSRAARWGKAIGQAGAWDLTEEELIRLQQIVIENSRFVEMGFRKKGGFVGEHDRITGEPVPEHISAKSQDLTKLMTGLLETNKKLVSSEIDAVIAATIVAFGFVFIHPFEDGNGRIHRYLVHHVLAKKRFSRQGMIFPVSASILDHINEYREVLEYYSHSLLDFIDWKETNDHNINVLNDTIDYYRYCDYTAQAEFLYDCVFDTIENIIPLELTYLARYDDFKEVVDEKFEMPDRLVALLLRHLEQNDGLMSKRSRNKEFAKLSDEEVRTIEKLYKEIFG